MPSPAAGPVLEAVSAALAAVEPERAIRRRLRWDGRTPIVDGIPLHPSSDVVVVAVGKAAAGMARAAVPESFPVRGVVVAPQEVSVPPGLDALVGDHPVPGTRSFAAGAAIRDLVAATGPSGLILALISGGASALAEVPAPGITPDDITDATTAMLTAGIPITAMNALRIGMSGIKGGRLASLTPASILTLVVSDVPDDDPALIGSGPTVAGEWDGAMARHVAATVAPGLADRLSSPPPGRSDLPTPIVVASGSIAAAAAIAWARSAGLAPRPGPPLGGPATAAGRGLARLALGLRPGEMVVAHGETTVVVDGPGLGGRNQEAALAAAIELAGSEAVVGFVASDGVDGPTDHAGAIVDGGTADRIRAAGRDPVADLHRHDATRALAAAGDLITTGPSGTNVGDLAVAYRPG